MALNAALFFAASANRLFDWPVAAFLSALLIPMLAATLHNGLCLMKGDDKMWVGTLGTDVPGRQMTRYESFIFPLAASIGITCFLVITYRNGG